MRTVRFPASLAALAVAFALLAPAAQAENRGVLIHPGDRVRTAIEPEEDTDEFVLDALAGTVLTVTATAAKGGDLQPGLEVLDPSGSALDLTGFLSTKGPKAFVRKLPLEDTGRYLVRVVPLTGGTGEYQMKTKGQLPKPVRLKAVSLAPDETLGVGFGAVTDALLKAKVKARGGEGFAILSVVDPTGEDVPGAADRFVVKPTSAKGNADLSGGFGDYALRLRNGPAAATFDVTLKVKLPKIKAVRLNLSPEEPKVLGVDPFTGSENESTTVIGTRFAQTARVFFSGTPARETVFVSSSELRATVPAGSGLVDVTVRNPDGQEHTKPGSFRILPTAPAFSSLSPREGPSTGGTVVEVAGERLLGVTAVQLGGTTVADLSVLTDTALRFTTLPHLAGPAALTLIDGSNRRTVAENAFTFLAAFEDVTMGRMPPADAGGGITGGAVLALGDIDGDRDVDLLVANDVSPFLIYYAGYDLSYGIRVYGMRIFLNDGSGDFQTEKTLPAPSEIGDGWQARAMALGDLDGDTDLDLVIVSGEPFYGGALYYYDTGGGPEYFYELLYSSTRVLLNDGSGNLSPSSTALPHPSAKDGTDILNAHAVALGDLDGDGDLDLVLTHRWSAYTAYSIDFYSSSLGKDINLTRFDGYDYSTPATRILLNDGSGGFTDVTDTALPDVADGDVFAADAVVIGDVDGDDHPDIVISSDAAAYYDTYSSFVVGSKTRILKGDGKGGFVNATKSLFPAAKEVDEWGGRSLALGDLDDDGWQDLVLSTGRYLYFLNPYAGYQYVSSTRIFRGGDGGFKETTFAWMPAVVHYWDAETFKATKVTLGDLDDDDDLDIVLSLYRGVYAYDSGTELFDTQIRSLRWLQNQGNGVMRDVSAAELPSPAETNDHYVANDVALGDLDGDGDLDILLTGDGFTLHYYISIPFATRQMEKR